MPKYLQASQQEIDKLLEIAVSETIKSIIKVPEEKRDWDTVVSVFSTNHFVVQTGDEHRCDSSYKPSDKNMWKGTDKAIIQEVKAWFNELICDSDALQDKEFDFESVAKLVATAGKDAISQLEGDNSDDTYREASIVEHGILRYPLPTQPYFRVYSIQLFAWSGFNSKSWFGRGESRSGIAGCQFVMFGVLHEPLRADWLGEQLSAGDATPSTRKWLNKPYK
ncbi:hypothetical protein FRC02_001216 [Tulasnella sp. 418]|nr:hypothetical protein FRC02_001216 [Tulasnella sp. 418]